MCPRDLTGAASLSESEGALCRMLRDCILFKLQSLTDLDFQGFSLCKIFYPDSLNHVTPMGRGQVKVEKGRGDQEVRFMKNITS